MASIFGRARAEDSAGSVRVCVCVCGRSQDKDFTSAAGVFSRVGVTEVAHMVAKLVPYKGFEKTSKHVEDEGRQFSHYRRRKLQIWRGGG